VDAPINGYGPHYVKIQGRDSTMLFTGRMSPTHHIRCPFCNGMMLPVVGCECSKCFAFIIESSVQTETCPDCS